MIKAHKNQNQSKTIKPITAQTATTHQFNQATVKAHTTQFQITQDIKLVRDQTTHQIVNHNQQINQNTVIDQILKDHIPKINIK